MPYENGTIAKKWKLIQLLTKKGYEFSERKNKNIGRESQKVQLLLLPQILRQNKTTCLLFCKSIKDQGAYRKSQKHSQKALENAKKSFKVHKLNVRIKLIHTKAGTSKYELTESEKYTCCSSSRTCTFSENECCYFTGVAIEDVPDD